MRQKVAAIYVSLSAVIVLFINFIKKKLRQLHPQIIHRHLFSEKKNCYIFIIFIRINTKRTRFKWKKLAGLFLQSLYVYLHFTLWIIIAKILDTLKNLLYYSVKLKKKSLCLFTGKINGINFFFLLKISNIYLSF